MKGNLLYNLQLLFLTLTTCRSAEYVHILLHSASESTKK